MGRHEEALARLERSARSSRASFGSERNIDFLRGNIAGIYNALGPLQRGRRGARGDAGVAELREQDPAARRSSRRAYVGLGLKTRALETAEQAVALAKGMPPDDIGDGPGVARVGAPGARAFRGRVDRSRRARWPPSRTCASTPSPTIFSSAGSVSGISGCSPRASRCSRRRGGRGRRSKPPSARGRARFSISSRAGSAQAWRPRPAATGAAPATFAADGRRRRAPALDRRRLLGQRHRDVRLGREPRRPARLGAHRRDGRRARRRWCATPPAVGRRRSRRCCLAPAAAHDRGARSIGCCSIRCASICRRGRGAGSRSCRTGRCSACRSRRCATPSDRYLIESYDIHYVPAVGALSYMSRASPRARDRSSALLVGDPSPDAARDRVMALPALPWAGREVETIAGC